MSCVMVIAWLYFVKDEPSVATVSKRTLETDGICFMRYPVLGLDDLVRRELEWSVRMRVAVFCDQAFPDATRKIMRRGAMIW